MTAPTPEQMRELAGVLDRCADNDRNAVRVPLLHESAATLRAAADQIEAVQAVCDRALAVKLVGSTRADAAAAAIASAVKNAILTADTEQGA